MSIGPAFLGVLRAAEAKFGPPETWNRPMVAAWVKQRMRQLIEESRHVVDTPRRPEKET